MSPPAPRVFLGSLEAVGTDNTLSPPQAALMFDAANFTLTDDPTAIVTGPKGESITGVTRVTATPTTLNLEHLTVGSLEVTDVSNLDGDVTVGGTLTANGDVSVVGGLSVVGSSGLQVDNDANVDGSLTVGDAINAHTTIVFSPISEPANPATGKVVMWLDSDTATITWKTHGGTKRTAW